MCIIAIQPEGHSFTDAQLRDFHRKNRDGHGFMWYTGNGTINTYRNLGDANDLISAYRKHVDKKAAVIHCRWSTHGGVTLENAHPHMVFADGAPYPIAMVHNGVIAGYAESGDKSDTRMFITEIIEPWLKDNPEYIHHPDAIKGLEKIVGVGNRMVFMGVDGRVSVINKDAGTTRDGVWYSNTYAWDAWPNVGGYAGHGWSPTDGYGHGSWRPRAKDPDEGFWSTSTATGGAQIWHTYTRRERKERDRNRRRLGEDESYQRWLKARADRASPFAVDEALGKAVSAEAKEKWECFDCQRPLAERHDSRCSAGGQFVKAEDCRYSDTAKAAQASFSALTVVSDDPAAGYTDGALDDEVTDYAESRALALEKNLDDAEVEASGVPELNQISRDGKRFNKSLVMAKLRNARSQLIDMEPMFDDNTMSRLCDVAEEALAIILSRLECVKTGPIPAPCSAGLIPTGDPAALVNTPDTNRSLDPTDGRTGYTDWIKEAFPGEDVNGASTVATYAKIGEQFVVRRTTTLANGKKFVKETPSMYSYVTGASDD